MVLTADLTRWAFWWEFNKDPFIRLKEAIHSEQVSTGSDEFFMGVGRRMEAKDTLKPSETQIMQEILPSLKDMIDRTDQQDIVSSVLVAMGKIGKNHPDFEILPIMAESLSSSNQEISETAALAMGISQLLEGVDEYLIHLVDDGEVGRRLVNRGSVNYRTRSFAAYGLGLVAHSTSNIDVKTRCLEVLQEILRDESIASRDVRVAAINGLSLLAVNPESTEPKEKKLLEDTLSALETYFMTQMGAGDQMIQSHVPPAIAKLLGRDGPEALVTHYKDLFLAELQDRSRVKRGSNDIYRSVVLALGKLCQPNDGRADNPDLKYSQALLDYYRDGKDIQAKLFTNIALAQIGGVENRNALLRIFASGNKAIEKPWAAVALGVYAHYVYEAASESGLSNDGVERLIGDQLHKALDDNKNPDTIAALAIGLGLCKYTEAADDLRDLLIKHRQKDELAGYLCIGLALMDDQRSKDDITDIVSTSIRRPVLLSQAAIALGKLGDKQVTDLLQKMMVDGDQTLAKMSAIASALGFIGDRRTIGPLTETMFDDSLTDLTRAFAVVALGGVADKEDLPWNSKIGVDLNYRASVETLTTGSGTGILDIL
jgi:HEAT repeat protein